MKTKIKKMRELLGKATPGFRYVDRDFPDIKRVASNGPNEHVLQSCGVGTYPDCQLSAESFNTLPEFLDFMEEALAFVSRVDSETYMNNYELNRAADKFLNKWCGDDDK